MERVLSAELKPKYVIGGADIFVGTELIPALPATLKRVCPGESLALLFERECRETAAAVFEELSGDGFKVQSFAVGEESLIPEYVRFVLAVGGEDCVDGAKNSSAVLDCGYAVFLTSPSSDTVLRGRAPKQVYLDSAVLKTCPRECVAAGWGIVLSEPLRRFEEYFARKVLNLSPAEYPKLKELPADADETALALRLLELSQRNAPEDNATVMAKLLGDVASTQGVRRRLFGEYKFVCASVLAVFYSGYLSSPSMDCALPPCHDRALDEIARLTARPRETLLNSFDFFDTNSYFRINYILGEYRLDLLENLKSIDLTAARKRWRRTYPDAGYWLKSAFTASTLLTALRLSAEIGNGLLRYIGETGFAACA